MTEAVNGLLHVTDKEQILSLLGNPVENGILHFVGILIFVNHQLHKPPGNLFRLCSGLCSFSVEQTKGFLFQIVVIQHMTAAFFLGIAHQKFLRQCQQTPYGRCRRLHILQHRCIIVAEAVQAFVQFLPNALP